MNSCFEDAILVLMVKSICTPVSGFSPLGHSSATNVSCLAAKLEFLEGENNIKLKKQKEPQAFAFLTMLKTKHWCHHLQLHKPCQSCCGNQQPHHCYQPLIANLHKPHATITKASTQTSTTTHKPNLYHRPPFKNLTTYPNISDTTTESSHNPTNHEQNASTIMDLPSSTPSHHKHNQPNNIRTKSNHPNRTPISKDCCQRPSVGPTTTNPSKPCSRTTKWQTQFTTNSTLILTSTTSNQINQSESIPKIQMNQNPYITWNHQLLFFSPYSFSNSICSIILLYPYHFPLFFIYFI